MFAVIRTGGKQYRVTAGTVLKVETMAGEPGETVSSRHSRDGRRRPTVTARHAGLPGAAVTATVIAQDRLEKVIVFKKRRRQNSRRRAGHRQHVTVLRHRPRRPSPQAEEAAAEEAGRPEGEQETMAHKKAGGSSRNGRDTKAGAWA